MKCLVLTQDERLYLPEAFGRVCRSLAGQVAAVVTAPAMSTHGGTRKGFAKHAQLFGLRGTARMGGRIIRARLLDGVRKPGADGPFFSMRAVADAFEIPYHAVSKLKSPEFEEIMYRYQADLLISMSCPQIIGKAIRNRFPKGAINVHGAPLPKYRGLMPAFWVLRNGETKTATTVHDLEAKLDDGDILVQRGVGIEPGDTWDSLVRKTKREGASALVEAVRQIETGTVTRRPNLEEEATYYSFPTAKDRKAFLAAGRRFF